MENHNKTHSGDGSVHKILAHSYSMYFILFLIGICLDVIYNVKVFSSSSDNSPSVWGGVFLLMLGSFLILWAQKTSRHLNKENINKETFMHGPYCFTRTPTNFGLFFLVVGFGMVSNAFFVILTAFFSFFIAKFVFLNKEEEILAERYGAPYLEYKKSVKF